MNEYKKQLRELYETYTGKELEQELGVTTRSIQNYLKEVKPTKPSKEVIVKIRGAYAKHTAGNGMNSNTWKEEVNYKDKYLKSLEDQLKEKATIIESLLKDIKLDLQLLKANSLSLQHSQNIIASMQQGYMDYFVEKLLKQSPEKVLDEVKRKSY